MTKPLSFRQVQAMWGGAIAFSVFCIVFGGFSRKTFNGGLGVQHWLLIGAVAWSALGGISVRRRLVRRAASSSSGANPVATPWTAIQLVGIMLAESIVLWALVSNIAIASERWLSDLFYTLGVLLLFNFMPRKPLQLS